jgi:HSP20 family protein
MDELFSDLTRVGRRRARRAFRPAADVFRTQAPPRVVVTADLAGVDPDHIELAFSDGVLTIAGVRRREPFESGFYQQMELDYGPFERQVAVGDDVDPAAAEAIYDRGLLTVRFPIVTRSRSPVRLVITVVRQA